MNTSRDFSEVNSFIQKMGREAIISEKIPVVYMEDSKEVIIESNGKISDKKLRYSNGKDVVFRCKVCKDIIGKGKKTNEQEDKVSIYCFNCKNYHSSNGYIIWSKDSLWYKPENEKQRKDYEILMNTYLQKSNSEIIEI